MPLTLPLVGHGLRRQVEEVLLRAVVHKYNAPQCHDAQRLIKKKTGQLRIVASQVAINTRDAAAASLAIYYNSLLLKMHGVTRQQYKKRFCVIAVCEMMLC